MQRALATQDSSPKLKATKENIDVNTPWRLLRRAVMPRCAKWKDSTSILQSSAPPHCGMKCEVTGMTVRIEGIQRDAVHACRHQALTVSYQH